MQKKSNFKFQKIKLGEPPFSTDANLLHTSSEGKILEDPWIEPPEYVYTRTKNLINTPDKPETIEIEFRNGDPVGLNNNQNLQPDEILTKLNKFSR